MGLCWLSAYTLLPAYLTLLDRWFKIKWSLQKKTRAWFSEGVASMVQFFPGILVIISVLGVVLSVSTFSKFKDGIIETDLSKLRDKRSMEKGSGALYHYIDDIFRHSFSPMVVLPKSREVSRKIAQSFRDEKQREGKSSLISTVQTLDDFIPKGQNEKIQVIRQIRQMLPDHLVQHLPTTEQTLVSELLNPNALVSFTEQGLPSMILNKFRETDGSIGRIVLVDKVIPKSGEGDDAKDLQKFVRIGRSIADSVAPNTAVAGDLPISYDMFEAIVNDGPKATLFAFLSVVGLVILLFRDFKMIALALTALILGITWFAGVILGFHLKINFLNFIALPITFGIGIDYGVNIFERYQQEGPGRILQVIQNTGGAVMLCSFTTITGYSSLLIAGNQAFVSFGRLAVLGELACVFAAVISLPAFLCCMEKYSKNPKIS